MTREHFDEDGIIGSRPKRLAPPVDLGPLFNPPHRIERVDFFEASVIPREDLIDPSCIVHAPCNGEDVLDSGDGGKWEDAAGPFGPYTAEPATDDVPLDPRKPEPPTKAERIAAIRRITEHIRTDVLALALRQVGAPEPLAGITAADVHDLARRRPEAALMGSGVRAWSWLGPWLAALAREGALVVYRVKGHPVRRQARRKESHGNAHVVYLHPTDPRAHPVESDA